MDLKTGKSTVWNRWMPDRRTGLSDIISVRVNPDCQAFAYAAQ